MPSRVDLKQSNATLFKALFASSSFDSGSSMMTVTAFFVLMRLTNRTLPWAL
jgi:hypothetical protein